MKTTFFLNLIKEELEIESEFNFTTNMKELEEWSSLNAMVISSLVTEHFQINLTNAQLQSMTSVESLIEIIGKDKFES